MFRHLLTLMLLLCCIIPAHADEPDSLPACTTEHYVQDWLLQAYEDEGTLYPVEARAGYIRYIAQNQDKDPLFCRDYWCSVEPGHNFDLTAKVSQKGKTFRDHAGTMCTRAAYAMALSYLGIDLTPGEMSVLLNDRNIDDPYDKVTELVPGLKRITYKSNVFERMLDNYLTDSSYSPVYLYYKRPSGVYHAVLIVGRADEDGYYLVVDPAVQYNKEEEIVRVYRIRFDVPYRKILDSTFRSKQRGSRVVSFCQWQLTDATDD